MISSVEIVDSKNTPLSYVSSIPALKDGANFQFKPGVNIIIGKNGCGKSTLLNLLAIYTLCENSLYSTPPDNSQLFGLLKYQNLFNGEFVKDGIKIKCDYAGVVYHYLSNSDLKQDEVLSSVQLLDSFLTCNTLSTGESIVYSLSSLFNVAFSNKDILFPIEQLLRLIKSSNEVWSKRFKSLIRYYIDNQLSITRKDYEYTFLIDEPDRNLDITNIESIYSIFSYHKPQTQIIAVIHNPILIYKLSKLSHVNIIELTPSYLDSIKEVFNSL